MKKVVLSLVLLCSMSLCFAETPIQYNGKDCKLEIFTDYGYNNRYSKQLLENKVLDFCKDKKICNIAVTSQGNRFIYVIIYED